MDNFFRERGQWFRSEYEKTISMIWRRIGFLIALYFTFYGIGLLIVSIMMYIPYKH